MIPLGMLLQFDLDKFSALSNYQIVELLDVGFRHILLLGVQAYFSLENNAGDHLF